VLELTTRWIVHADGKAGLTLASAGVTGGVLYSVVQSRQHLGIAVLIAVGVCGLLVLVASMCAALSLWPRFHATRNALSPLYFRHIALGYPAPADASAYVASLRELTRDPEALTTEIATQVWANAHIAKRKYTWANLSLAALVLAFLTLGVACALLMT
jgi:hypothetical protein